MKNPMSYAECVEYILSVPMFAAKLGTDGLYQILELMGHPERQCPIIHVAGTNGKGSTCSFLASVLKETGKRVGVFTSPHLVRINERIRINDAIIGDTEFAEIFQKVMTYVALAGEKGIAHPSFFEFMFLMAAVYFAEQKVDYVIYETGMGGRLDATNVVNPVLCIITSIGLDHMQFLGNTIPEIAAEKAGIIKPDTPILHFDRRQDSTDVIRKYAEQMNAPVILVEKKDYKILKIADKTIDFSFESGYYKYSDLQIAKTALYQVENAVLAVKAFELLIRMTDADCDSDLIEQYIRPIRQGLLHMTWPCRMQCVEPHIYIDGAHNEEAIEAFCQTVETLFPTEKKLLLFAVSKDKDYETMIRRLCTIPFEEILIVRYEGDRSEQLNKVEDTFRRFSGSKITSFEDIRAGLAYGKDHVGDSYLFCVGSLYLAGDLLELGV